MIVPSCDQQLTILLLLDEIEREGKDIENGENSPTILLVTGGASRRLGRSDHLACLLRDVDKEIVDLLEIGFFHLSWMETSL